MDTKTNKNINRNINRNITRAVAWITKNRVYVMVSLLSAAVFVFIYGVHILNPCYTDWLLNGPDGDLSQHYLGWKFFRTDGWNFPLGMMDNIAYPNRVSIIFTDSIPLFALFFKLFRFLLPAEFQYFGWWGLLCFVLQGVFAAAILKKYAKNAAQIVLGSMLFVFAPVLIDRMYWMTSLSAHWLCLMGILLIEKWDRLKEGKVRGIALWALLGGLCASVHIYFLPMCGILLIGYCITDIAGTKKVLHSLGVLVGFLTASILVTALLGGFSSGLEAASYGLGDYSFNLNGFFNPIGRFHYWSKILSPLPQYIDNQYEGFAYLGLGVLLLLFTMAAQLTGSMREWKNGLDEAGKKAVMVRTASYLTVAVLAIFAAASPMITWNEKIVAQLPMPGVIRTIWEAFRASGRLVWPACYVLMFWAVAGDHSYIKKDVKTVILAGCLLLQLYDMKDVLLQKRDTFRNKIEHVSQLQNPAWKEMAEKAGMQHIIFMSDFVPDQKLLFSFADLAPDYHMTINDFYFARSPGERVQSAREAAAAHPAEDSLFVFYRQESQNCLDYALHYYEMDGLIAGCVKPLPFSEELTKEELSSYQFVFQNNLYLNNGEDREGIRYIHSYGNSYGPYLRADQGSYEVMITGIGLNNADLQCHYAHGDSPVEITDLSKTDTEITYRMTLTEKAEDLEVLVWNTGAEDMQLHEIQIRKESVM